MTIEQVVHDESAKPMASARIIIPCYNEEKRFQSTSFTDFKNPSHQIHFLFVDDGSVDETFRVLTSLTESDPRKFQLIRLARNSGKAEAVRQGVLSPTKSHLDYVGFWDADLATPLDAIGDFIDVAETQPELQLIMGSRVKLLGRRIERSRMRHYLGRVFATAVSLVLDLEVYDTQCGAKLFRVSPSTKSLFEKPFLSRWIFDVEILARLILATRGQDCTQPEQLILEYPLREWRDIPCSKLRSSDFIRAAWELLRISKSYFRDPQQ